MHTVLIILPHLMHLMWHVAINDPGISLSVCLSVVWATFSACLPNNPTMLPLLHNCGRMFCVLFCFYVLIVSVNYWLILDFGSHLQ